MIWEHWLRPIKPSVTYTKFQHFEYIESANTREQVAPTLARILYSYHSPRYNDEQLALLRELKFPRTAILLQGDQRPEDERTRRGNFAEILACEFAREILKFEIPVYRLQLSTNKEQSMKGDDILGFVFERNANSNFEVLVGESKYRSSFTSNTVQEAYEAIERGRPYPASMDFTANVLRQAGNNSRAEQVDQLKKLLSVKSPLVNLKRLIMLITMNRPRDPFGYIEELPNVVDGLTTVNISLNTGANIWINTVYETEVWHERLPFYE